MAVTAPESAGTTEVQIMPKSRKANTPKAAAQPARKTARKSAFEGAIARRAGTAIKESGDP